MIKRTTKQYLVIFILLFVLIIFLLIIFLLDPFKNNFQYGGGYSLEYDEEYENWIVKIEFFKAADTSCVDENGNKYSAHIMKFLRSSGNSDTFCIEVGGAQIKTIIDSYVSDVSYDSTFILVDQKPLDSIFGPIQEFRPTPDSNSWYSGRPRDPNMADLRKSKIHQYWIIDKTKDYIYGPLKDEEYFLKKRELGVPEDLRLKYEKK